MTISIREAALDDAEDARAVVEIIDSYARGPGGQGAPLEDQARAKLAKGLAEHPTVTVLLAFAGERPVGVAVCLRTYSTFAGKPALNVHDLAVLPADQGRGIGRALLERVADVAREAGCCKVTLEVHDTNEGAKRLYRDVGFGPWEPATLFVSKPL
jgi:ribosomal protein S18 acetylase RimI-like enzyme